MIRWTEQGILFRVLANMWLGHASISTDGSSRVYEQGNASRPDSIQLATITTDTGDFAPGNRDFSRFTKPGLCIAAGDQVSGIMRRSVAAQIALAELRDTALMRITLPVGGVNVVRTCIAQFTVETVAATDLLDLFTVALMANRDSLANAVVAHRLVLATTAVAKDTVLQQTIRGFLAAEPTRLAAAESTVAHIDAFGTTWQTEQVDAHFKLLNFAWLRFDEDQMQREANRIIALSQGMPFGAYNIDHAYKALGAVAALEHPDSIMAIMARAKNDLSRFPQFSLINYKTASVEEIWNQLAPPGVDRYDGRSFPQVSASYWFPKAPESWPPEHGKPSLVLFGGPIVDGCARYFDDIFWSLEYCTDRYTTLQELMTQYGSRLTITLISHTHGFAVRSLALSPKEEADSLAWYIRDHDRIPLTFGVVVDPTAQLPEPDGRIFRQDTTFSGTIEQVRNYPDRVFALLYDAQGKLVYAGNQDFPFLRRMIAHIVGETPVTTPSALPQH